jgi:hypothetical protein
MNIQELIEELKKYDENLQVVFGNLDSENEDGNAILYEVIGVEPLVAENNNGKIQCVALCG